MYLIRRVYKVKPGTASKAAEIIAQIGKVFEEGGRSPTRVYVSGGRVPGPPNTVYMEWTAEKIEAPRRPENKTPEGLITLGKQLWELQEDTYIEFYELVKDGPWMASASGYRYP